MMSCQEFFARARGRKPDIASEHLYAAYETYLTCPRSQFRSEGLEPVTDCGRCGHCCRRPWRIEVSLPDVLRWAREDRADILSSLEHSPMKLGEACFADVPILMQLACNLAGRHEDEIADILTIAQRVMTEDGSYVLPKNLGCKYLVDGKIAVCHIYESRPDVCRQFPPVI
jgi:Fe-S-cluster containining protein